MEKNNVNSLFIDVKTSSLNLAIRTLERLKTTKKKIESDGAYREDTTYSKIYIETSWSEEQLEDWLYNSNAGIDYVGVCEAPIR